MFPWVLGAASKLSKQRRRPRECPIRNLSVRGAGHNPALPSASEGSVAAL